LAREFRLLTRWRRHLDGSDTPVPDRWWLAIDQRRHLQQRLIRARGFSAGGQYNGSSWYFVETNIGPLAIVQQPLSRTSLPGANASFTVRVGGGSPPVYQWRKNGTNLANTANIAGVTNATLAISTVFGLDSGAYTVVINDGHTTLTSLVATLTVPDPIITLQPVSLTNNALTTATFAVAAIGRSPLSYSWIKNGTTLNDTANISGSHTSTLTLSNVSGRRRRSLFGHRNQRPRQFDEPGREPRGGGPDHHQPACQHERSFGGRASFSVGVIGSPMSFTWYQNNSAIVGTDSTLSLSNLAAANVGSYFVVVSNAYGTLVSSAVLLSVNYATADALNPGLTPYAGQGVNVASLAVQADGEILFGG